MIGSAWKKNSWEVKALGTLLPHSGKANDVEILNNILAYVESLQLSNKGLESN